MDKVCSKCGIKKSLEQFHKHKVSSDGHKPACKECLCAEANEYSALHREEAQRRAKNYRTAHLEESLARETRYRRSHLAEAHARDKMYYQAHSAELKAYQKAYRKAHPEVARERARTRRAEDANYRLTGALRNRLVSAIKNGQTTGSAVRDLGCTVAELKQYLESKFLPGMTWENWSHTGWHIDHIRPLASFDLTDRQQFLQACHYTNLQPLWAEDNLRKGDKLAA